jgi:hypothetical protein
MYMYQVSKRAGVEQCSAVHGISKPAGRVMLNESNLIKFYK